MPRYKYLAKTTPQDTLQGEIEAETEQEAIAKLNKMGYFPISVKSDQASLKDRGLGKLWKISRKELVLFSTQLSTLIGSGVNILNSLRIISDQTPNKYLRSVLSDVSSKIKDGDSLSESLKNYPQFFGDLYIAMIHSGEASGGLDKTLKRLAEHMEKEEELRNSITAALTYPLFIFSVGVLTVVVLLTFVIPRLVNMFSDMGQMLPLPTKILISISSAMRSYWWLMLAAVFAAIFFYKRMSSNQQFRVSLDKVKLKTPVFGKVILRSQISRMMRTLSLLLSSGIPIISSLSIAASVIDNQILKSEVVKFKDQISQGMGFADCLKSSALFPVFATSIVNVGEETGTMAESLIRIADDYDKDIDAYLKALTRLLEPVIILSMGAVVGFIVLSMLLPIFQINLLVR